MGGDLIGRNYATKALQSKTSDIERRISSFIKRFDRGDPKCAFRLLDTVINVGSITVTEDEAILIFQSAYQDIKALAEDGDTEAMLMVADGIRYGFVDDEEPYMYWISRASALGNAKAAEAEAEFDREENPLYLPDPVNAAERYVNDESLAVVPVSENTANDSEIPDDRVLIADADFLVREELGINDYLDEPRKKREQLSADGWCD